MRLDRIGGLACLLLGMGGLIGCGSAETVVKVTPPPAVEQLRTTLNQIGEAGMVDSSVEYVQQLAEEIAAADPSKAKLVEAGEKLARSRGKSAVKKQVDAMLGMLDGG
jgi:hypothetical protein